ncbi:LysR substrate-binding domain-containing protein [Streptomyces pharetrae]|uniref:LysR substrate-binding domain-containing protein n=1 Tax=Streptomyces pharetrae TaxID=291370 RepID=UPI003356E21B
MRARLAARGITAQLRVSLMPFNVGDLHPYCQAFRARYPHRGLQSRQMTFTDVFGQLRSGAMDVMVLWLPVEEPDFIVGPILRTDSRILAVAADHRLAARDSVPLELLADFPHGTALGLPDYWEDSSRNCSSTSHSPAGARRAGGALPGRRLTHHRRPADCVEARCRGAAPQLLAGTATHHRAARRGVLSGHAMRAVDTVA